MSSVASFGIGEAANTLRGFGRVAFQIGAHGTFNGIMSAGFGGSYFSGFSSGALSSLAGTGSGLLLEGAGDVGRAFGMVFSGAITGGVGAEIMGGGFWDGFRSGAITAGLNHVVHDVSGEQQERSTLEKWNDYVKGANDAVSTVVDLTKAGFSPAEIEFLSKTGRVTWGIGLVTTGVDAKLAYDAIKNGQPWKEHTYNVGIGAVGLTGPYGAATAFILDNYLKGSTYVYKNVVVPVNRSGPKWMMNKINPWSY